MQTTGWTFGFALSTLIWALGIGGGYALMNWASEASLAVDDALHEVLGRATPPNGNRDTTGRAAPERKSDWEVFTFILSRNLSVYIWLLAGLLSAGAITFFVLLMNGVTLGQTIAAAMWAGLPGWALCDLLLPHGVLELGTFCIAGAAGFQGFRLAFGGLEASREGIRSLRLGLVMVFGVCALSVAAGVEAFVTAELAASLRATAMR